MSFIPSSSSGLISTGWLLEEVFLNFVWVKPVSLFPTVYLWHTRSVLCARNLFMKADGHHPCLGLRARSCLLEPDLLTFCLPETMVASGCSYWTEDHMAQTLSLMSLCPEGITSDFSSLSLFWLPLLTWRKNCFLYSLQRLISSFDQATLSLPLYLCT